VTTAPGHRRGVIYVAQHLSYLHAVSKAVIIDATHIGIAILQKMAVGGRRGAKPTTQHRSEVGLVVRQATIVLLAANCRQESCKPINVSCRGHAEKIATHDEIS